MGERVRFTISVEPEVHAAFSEFADAAGQSLSRAVGDWLRDTSESSLFVATKLRELRKAPSVALAELAEFQERMGREVVVDAAVTRKLSADLDAGLLRFEDDAPRGEARGARTARGEAASKRPKPPSSPTGVKTSPNAKGRA